VAGHFLDSFQRFSRERKGVGQPGRIFNVRCSPRWAAGVSRRRHASATQKLPPLGSFRGVVCLWQGREPNRPIVSISTPCGSSVESRLQRRRHIQRIPISHTRGPLLSARYFTYRGNLQRLDREVRDNLLLRCYSSRQPRPRESILRRGDRHRSLIASSRQAM
jgi:hypothetical protein